MPAWDPKANAIFWQAMNMPAGQSQQDYLQRACAGDAALREGVERLLQADREAGKFLCVPAKLIVGHGSGALGSDAPRLAAGAWVGPYELLAPLGEGAFGVVYRARQHDPVQREVALKILKAGIDSREVLCRFDSERQALALMDHPFIAKFYDAGTVYAAAADQGGPIGEASRPPRSDAPRPSSPTTGAPDPQRTRAEVRWQSLAHAQSHLASGSPAPSGCPLGRWPPWDTGRPYFVMELVEGLPIHDFCDQHRLPVRPRLELFIRVCQAVQHAHQKGIIHRDLKPTNILVALCDGVPVPKVIDFGIAKATSHPRNHEALFTACGQIVGTPMYMSPEQTGLKGLDIDTRSDIYSLGALLYELLTGSTPLAKERLQAAGFDEMRRLICEEEPLKPSTQFQRDPARPSRAAHRSAEPARLEKTLHGELDWIVMKALEKERERRYETASALVDDLTRYLRNEAVRACPPSIRYRWGKWLRRNRAMCLAATALGLVLVAASGISTWQALRAAHAQARAEQHAANARQQQRAAVTAMQAEQAARAAEARQRERAEAHLRRIQEQQQLLENDAEVQRLITEQILRVLKDSPTPTANQRALLVTALGRLGELDLSGRVAGWHIVGNHFVKLKEYEQALWAYGQGLELVPQHAGIFVSRGDVWFRQGEFERAIADYTAALAACSQNDPARTLLPHVRRGLAHCRQLADSEALADFRTSYDAAPRPTLALLVQAFSGRWIAPVPLSEPLRSDVFQLIDDYVHSQQEEVAARSFAADALVELAWYDRAAAHLEAAYGSGRAGYYVHYQRAVLALLQEDGPAYRRACRAAMAAVPAGGAEPEPNGWAFTAYLCSLAPGGLDDYEPAVQLARRALAQHPGSGHCRFVLGVALFRAGQYDEARTNLAACLETNEDPQASHAFSPWVLAMAEQRLGHPDPAQRWHARGCAVAKTAPYYNWRYQTIARVLCAESRRAVHGAD